MHSESSGGATVTTSPFTRKAFVWSVGEGGLRVARLLAERAFPVLFLDERSDGAGAGEGVDPPHGVTLVRGRRLVRVEGHVGRFRLHVEGEEGATEVWEAGCLVLHASDDGAASGTGRRFPPEVPLLTVEELEALVGGGTDAAVPAGLALWLDPEGGAPDRARAQRAMRAARSLRADRGAELYVLMQHVTLWGLDGQSLYDALRDEGARFFRVGRQRPEVKPSGDGVEIEVWDATLPERPVRFRVDRLVEVGRAVPPNGAREMGERLGEPLDGEGFLQRENVHLYPSGFLRRGIYVVGGGKGEQAVEELEEEVLALVSELREPFRTGTLEAPEGIRIHEGHCVHCLTCHRVCPHGAIQVSSRPVPEPIHAACVGCGLCESLCPGNAIERVGRPGARILAEVRAPHAAAGGTAATVVFACSRSGMRALASRGGDLPEEVSVIEVPCACAVSEEMLLAALEAGAERVRILGCHEDNCASQRGTRMGLARVERVSEVVSAFDGEGADRLRYVSVAPNEAHRLAPLLERR